MLSEWLNLGFVLAGLVLALTTLPGTLELLMLTLAGQFRAPTPPRRERSVRLAVVVPAHDEAQNVAACVNSLNTAIRASCEVVEHAEVIVVADNCTDDTAAVARASGARVLERKDEVNRGKGYALDFAFAELVREDFDAVLVVDADSEVDDDFLTHSAVRFVGGAHAVQCRYAVLNKNQSLRTRLMSVALFAFNVLRPRGRERLGLSVGILGNGFGVTFDTLKQVPYDAASVVEDLEYHLRLVEAGFRVEFIDETAVRALMPTGGQGAATQRARWEGGRLRMVIDCAPGLVKRIGTGQWRLVEPLLELLLLPLAFHVALIIPLLFVPNEWLQLYALGAIAVVALHVLSAVRVGGGDAGDLMALAAAPFYVIWKLTLLRALKRNAARDADWIRTEREPQTGTQQ